jgi:hypothetical protein
MTEMRIADAPAEFDRPRENETITSREYSFRIGVSERIRDEIVRVEIVFDPRTTRTCREVAGSYLYDWSGYRPGEHKVTAVITTRDERKIGVGPRRFFVELGRRENPRAKSADAGSKPKRR